MGHRRFLPASNQWRRDKKNFDGKVDYREPVAPKSGNEILKEIDYALNTRKRKSLKDNPDESLTSARVTCDQKFCANINRGTVSGCRPDVSCMFTETYEDGSGSLGYFIRDVVQYDSVSGDLETKLANGSVIFGQSGNLRNSEDALDGIIGFEKSNASVISQLASYGKVKKMFAHCLDGETGGGIFAIGHVVQPKVNLTRMIQDQSASYSVNMTGIKVGTQYLNLTTDAYGKTKKTKTVIDSGTTLAYLPEVIYKPLVKKIVARHSDMRLRLLQDQYTCFEYSGRKSFCVLAGKTMAGIP